MQDQHALVFPDVPLGLSCVFVVELVDGAFSLGDGFSAFGLGSLVARFDFGGLFLAPVPEQPWVVSRDSQCRTVRNVLDHLRLVFINGLGEDGSQGGRLGARSKRRRSAERGQLARRGERLLEMHASIPQSPHEIWPSEQRWTAPHLRYTNVWKLALESVNLVVTGDLHIHAPFLQWFVEVIEREGEVVVL